MLQIRPAIVGLLLLAPASATASPALPSPPMIHVVRPGETVWTIARQHGLPPDQIVSANRLRDPDRLQIGDRLAVPAAAPGKTSTTTRAAAVPAAAVHVIQAGESLWSVARRHGTTVDTLVRLNRPQDADRVRPGQQVVLPSSAARGTAPPPARVRRQWRWPSRGVITSRFGFRGRRHHHGIDIAAPVGTPIYAVRDGTVRFTGRRGGYGLLVILEHGEGLTTWYGHASRILVTVGQAVRQGETIAAVGTTGNVTGPNVHFEVRRDNVPVDPLRFLQAR